jgi:glutaminase
MPAKSGVGGGIVAVLPGQFGLAVYSPRLDAKGNSLRGIAVCEALSSDFGMHMLRVTRTTATSVIRSSYTAAEVHSKLARDRPSRARLVQEGQRILIVELAGELMFVSAEIVASTAAEMMEERDFLVLDLSRVVAIDRSAAILLAELMEALIGQDRKVLVTGSDRHFAFCQAVRNYFRGQSVLPNFDYPDVDRALEYAEDRILEQTGLPAADVHEVPLERQPLCKGLDAAELELLRTVLLECTYGPGDKICREGDPADRVFFLRRGRVSVSLQLDTRHNHRLGAFAAGWVFGESAFFDGHARTADIFADGPASLYSLEPSLLRTHPDPRSAALVGKMMTNLAEMNLERLQQANQEIRILTR